MTIQTVTGDKILTISAIGYDMTVTLLNDQTNNQIFVKSMTNGEVQQFYLTSGANPAVIYDSMKITITGKGNYDMEYWPVYGNIKLYYCEVYVLKPCSFNLKDTLSNVKILGSKLMTLKLMSSIPTALNVDVKNGNVVFEATSSYTTLKLYV